MSNVRLTVSGNLGDDPDLRFTPAGKALVRMRVAVDARWQDGTGQWVNGPTDWYTVVAWEQLAERLAATVSKGDRVLVHGRLAQRAFQTESGERHTAWEITADDAGLSLRQRISTPVSTPQDTVT